MFGFMLLSPIVEKLFIKKEKPAENNVASEVKAEEFIDNNEN